MTVDKILRYTGIVLGLSSALFVKYSMAAAFLVFFLGLVLVKFGSQIKFERDTFLFLHGEKHE